MRYGLTILIYIQWQWASKLKIRTWCLMPKGQIPWVKKLTWKMLLFYIKSTFLKFNIFFYFLTLLFLTFIFFRIICDRRTYILVRASILVQNTKTVNKSEITLRQIKTDSELFIFIWQEFDNTLRCIFQVQYLNSRDFTFSLA